MKRIFWLLAVISAAFFCSCEDDSGEYIEQLYTRSQLTTGINTCLNVCTDTAVAHLCDTDCMNATDYRITLPTTSPYKALCDTLTALGYSYLIDSLHQQVNRACEQSGEAVTTNFKAVIKGLTYSDPGALVDGDDQAITTYFKTHYGNTLCQSLQSSLASPMQSCGATTTWSQMADIYHQSGAGALTADWLAYVTTQFMEAIFTEMAKEEKLIRTDASHRSGEGQLVIFN
ncbi:MAG: DUF4197 family protein [Bacteroidales bacterium]|nr:DUF4197 family protein [Bacteroidales bacterium]